MQERKALYVSPLADPLITAAWPPKTLQEWPVSRPHRLPGKGATLIKGINFTLGSCSFQGREKE